MKLKDFITHCALSTTQWIVSRLSLSQRYILGQRIAGWIYHHTEIRKKEVTNHLKRAFPGQSFHFYHHLTRQVYSHFGQMFLDILHCSSPSCGQFLTREHKVVAQNQEVLEQAVTQGKGVILLSGHLGNWELIPIWLAQNGYILHPVVKRQKNPSADKFFIKFRRKIPTYPLYNTADVATMLNVLKEGKILGLVVDQDARKKGLFVNFFGTPTSTPKGPAIFHLKTGAPLIMALCTKDKNGTYNLRFKAFSHSFKPFSDKGSSRNSSVKSITQQYTSYLEEEIKKTPEQYFWFHRRWKTRPPQ